MGFLLRGGGVSWGDGGLKPAESLWICLYRSQKWGEGGGEGGKWGVCAWVGICVCFFFFLILLFFLPSCCCCCCCCRDQVCDVCGKATHSSNMRATELFGESCWKGWGGKRIMFEIGYFIFEGGKEGGGNTTQKTTSIFAREVMCSWALFFLGGVGVFFGRVVWCVDVCVSV